MGDLVLQIDLKKTICFLRKEEKVRNRGTNIPLSPFLAQGK